MAAAPFITFIVPCYNIPAALLRACVESMLSLPLSNGEREIIVVDDGSEHSPADILADYGEDVQLISKPNGGLSSARNAGIAVAKGEHIQFVDADDCLLTKSYARCLELLRQTNADVLLFNLTHRNDLAEKKDQLQGPFSGDHYMLHHNLRGSACGMVFRRSLLGNLRFHEGMLHEDEEFTPQLILQAKSLFTTSLAPYFYRQRAGSITQTPTPEQWRRRIADTESVLSTLSAIASTLNGTPRLAMQRRTAQLTMDHLYHILRFSKTATEVETHVKRLSENGFLPLPDKHFTLKYSLFRLATASALGRRLLSRLLRLRH